MNAPATATGDRQVLRIERQLAHSVEKVWYAISDPKELSAWWPLQIDELPLRQGAALRFYKGDLVANGSITAVETGRVLGFADEPGEHEIRFELTPVHGGCLLVFTHTFPAGQQAAQHEAGWTQCFDLLEKRLAAGAAYQPGPAADAHAEKQGERWTVVMVRELKHSPAKVWHALTDPAQLREWAPFDAERNLAFTGPTMLTMVGGAAPQVMECTVQRAVEPRVLEYTWGTDLLRWELEKTDTGTRLTLRHTVAEGTWAPKVAAGWHLCLDVMERALDDHPIGRIVAGEAKKHGWERLNAQYAHKFGVENTGWPEQIPT